MKVGSVIGTATLALALAFGTVPGVLAQEKPLSEKRAQGLLKACDKGLARAQQAAERGDARGLVALLDECSENLETVNEALATGNVKENDVLDVAERVDQATLRHLPILESLLQSAPEGARPALERALQVSLAGHDTATQAVLNHAAVSVPGFLTLGTASNAMEKNDALLDQAARSQKHLEVLESLRERLPEEALPGLETALENSQRTSEDGLDRALAQFAVNMSEVTRAIEHGRVPEFQAESVLDLVDRSTRRHLPVLEDMLGRVPEQARARLERALQVSQRGNQAATAALARTPAAGRQTGRPAERGGPPGATGHPEDKPGGPPGGRPGPPR